MYAGQKLRSDVLGLLARLDTVAAEFLPDQEVTTTRVLYSGDLESGVALTWFGTTAMWMDDERTVSGAFTRGLQTFGMPEVQLTELPWQPFQTRNALRSVVASVLTQHRALQPGIEFELGPGAPMVLIEQPDVITGEPALRIVPRP